MAESWPPASDGRGVSGMIGARARRAVTNCTTGQVARCQQDRPQAEETGSQWGDSHTCRRYPAWEAEISAAKGAQGNGVQTSNAGAEITARRGLPLAPLPDWRWGPLGLSFRMLAPIRPGRQRDRRHQQMAFHTSFWRFRGDRIWPRRKSKHKHKHVKVLETFNVVRMLED